MARTRMSVWRPEAADALGWYGRAVIEMKKRPISDPLSWRYQAAIHSYDTNQDPFLTPGEPLPSDSDQQRFWLQCQHSSWFFLPWHRMYLHYFESIVAAQIVALDGPADWVLPYWNYSIDAMSRLLPPAFRSPTLGDGSPNGLYVEARNRDANAGNPFADDRDADLNTCLVERQFAGSPFGASSGFGGPTTGFNHGDGPVGALENVPHGTMHVAVNGFMASFETAALDPVFWLHHANIDRLWQVWLNRPGQHKNPAQSNWLSDVAFEFHDENGNIVSMRARDVLDSSTGTLNYVYDDVTDPLAPAGGAVMLPIAGPEVSVSTNEPPEMLGATSAPVPLQGATTHASVPISAPMPPPEALSFGAPKANKLFLNLENVTSDGRPPPYDVYVNVPDDGAVEDHEHLHVGRMPLFGVAEASKTTNKHTGSGLHYVFDITDVFGKLAEKPGFDASKVRVSFVPKGVPTQANVSVGRVSIYKQ
jgi:tyrosinase